MDRPVTPPQAAEAAAEPRRLIKSKSGTHRMTYTAYSFVALSRLRQAKPGLPPEHAAAPSSDALKLTGSARISGIGLRTPWYIRLFQRRRAAPLNDRFEFELVLNLNPKPSTDAGAEPLDLRPQLGLTPDVKSAVIEVFVVPDQ